MVDANPISIEHFNPKDQSEAKTLILNGLGEHWGFIDYSANPDLDDIAVSYALSEFLVARCNGKIVGTGALKSEGENSGRIVRMSVARDMRRRGIGTAVLSRLVALARQSGLDLVVLETTATWSDVIEFYRAFGFTVTRVDGANIHLSLELETHAK